MTDAQAINEQSWCWRDAKTKCTWVFGMRWLPSLGHKGKRHLYRNLRQQGLIWAVTHGRALSLVGVHTQDTANKPQRQMASAAVAFAMAHPHGVHALCLQVTGIGVWFVASSQGCVLSETDRWFETLKEAQLALQPLRERHDPMRYEELVRSPDCPDAEPDSVATPPFLRAQALKACQFRKIPSGELTWPLFLAFGCLGLATMLVVHQLWISPKVAVDHATLTPAPTAMTLRVHLNKRLHDLFKVWASLPVDPSGWVLQHVRCRVAGDSVSCRADYQRQKPGADNGGLASHMPSHWQFMPQSLDVASFERRLVLPFESRSVTELVEYDSGLTRLQRLSAKLAALSVGSPQQINLSSPLSQSRHLESGMHTKRALTVRLALREAAVLDRLRLPMRWHQIDLSVVQGAQIDQQHGYLMVTLKGDWLVRSPHIANKALADSVMSEPEIPTHLAPQTESTYTLEANVYGEPHETE